jgi:nucleoid DNA-binding protein
LDKISRVKLKKYGDFKIEDRYNHRGVTMSQGKFISKYDAKTKNKNMK